MNIFRLSNHPVEAAQFNQDIHVRKIIVEISQLLANCYSLEELKNAPLTQSGKVRGHSHIHHPISRWIKESINNFNWAAIHGMELGSEFRYRFGKPHFSYKFINWCFYNKPNLPDIPETEQPQCFKAHPDCMVINNPVAGYVNYYNKCKLSFNMRGKTVKATWTKREIPAFVDKNKLDLIQ